VNNKVFPCKDCDIEFSTAAGFSAHIPGCAPPALPKPEQLAEAAKLLLQWANECPRGYSRGARLAKRTLGFLKDNNLYGDSV